MGSRYKSDGFTLVELLVVIAIIGVLIALLLPAVQQAREAARRMQCRNNFKQLGLAMHMYHDTYQTFPAGNYSCCWGTWQVAVLPYLELKSLYDRYDQSNKYVDDGYRYSGAINKPVCEHRIAALTCPSDEPNTPISTMTSHNYAANFGNVGHGQSTLNGVAFGGAPFAANNSTVSRYYGLRDVTDGTSSTMLMGEVLQGKENDLRGFSWWEYGSKITAYLAPNSSQPDAFTGGTCVNLPDQNLPCIGSTTSTYPAMHASRSRHPGGVQIVLCDGSARFVSENVNLDTWRALSTTRGAEVVGDY